MKKCSIIFIPLIVIGVAFCVSCRSHEALYIQDMERDSSQAIYNTYYSIIHPGDQLYINVFSQTPESAVPFNQETHIYVGDRTLVNNVGRQNGETHVQEVYGKMEGWGAIGYVVDENGYITFPFIGRIHVAGLMLDSISSVIQQKIIEGDYIYDPVVSVSLMNFRVSVLGEVRNPKELHISGDRLTLFEALAMCGDVTIYGQRDNIVVMRVKDSMTIPIEVDMTHKTVFDSEVYYLQNNDIIYVQPNKLRQREIKYRNASVPEYLAITVQVVSILRTLMRSYSRINNATE